MIFKEIDKEAKEIISNMSEKEKERLHAIIAMNTLVCSMNDETAYMTWIYLVPDCANIYDFIDFAEGDENLFFDDAVDLFKRLWKNYAAKNKGLYIGGKCY